MNAQTNAHHTNASDIITAIAREQLVPVANAADTRASGAKSMVLNLPGLKHYHQHLLNRFGDVVDKPSFEYISKVPESWLIVGDRRREISADILLIIERHGLGVGMLVLHLQQIRAGHILSQITENGNPLNLVAPTEYLSGADHERVLSVPIRRFRADFARLAELNIAKPRILWNPERIITHERDLYPCFYCSCPEINPAEVVVDIEGPRHGLSRDYSLGFTFAPFGNPLNVVHFLAWDRARRPLNMNRVPMTVSDLVKLTREINLSIRMFFADTRVRDYPVLDGISNGWAGNTIYHQHFQFFAPEHPAPLFHARTSTHGLLLDRDDVTIERLEWPSPVYYIRATAALNAGLVGNDLAGIWRLLGGSRKVPYKSFGTEHVFADRERVPAHTQNIYVPGEDLGTVVWFILRDRERVDFRASPDDFVNLPAGRRAQSKTNIGVLESTGTLIVDDRASFDEMRAWEPEDISRQVHRIISAIAPEASKVHEFEAQVKDLFPL